MTTDKDGAEGKRCDGQAVQYNTIKARFYPIPAQAELFEKTLSKKSIIRR